MTKTKDMDSKVAAAKKRVGNVKGIDKKTLEKPKVSPILGKGKIGAKIKWKFNKGGMAKKADC